ncbi:hypothetical protein [Calothrix sp. NIES-2100]|uniref:hypothetical protein n=1 Tax=Calothrix sp. NIES-2100 TaxID=1954172 RepID=UPI0030D72E39
MKHHPDSGIYLLVGLFIIQKHTPAGLVGSYDTVAARIADFVEVGVDTFMLQFQPFPPEMKRFAEEVMPRVRSRELVA